MNERFDSNEGLLEAVVGRLDVARGPDKRGEYVAWCCFHPDGKGKPPHQPNLCVSVRGYFCHACKAKGGLTKLAKHLGIDCEFSGGVMEHTYDYRDEQGKRLYQVVRSITRRFFQRRPDGKGVWVPNLDGVKRVLYRLPDLIARPEELVFVVEGEKDADTLAGLGLLATTNPGGAGKWRPEYSETLKGRDVVNLPDNDEPGREHAEEVAKSLAAVGCKVKVVPLPGLPEKGDVSDWVASGRTVEELYTLVEKAKQWTPGTGEPDSTGSKGDSAKEESQAKRLVVLVEEAGAELFHDERKEPYAAVPLPEGRRILSLDSRDFRLWLAGLAWRKKSWALRRDALDTVRSLLASRARFDGAEQRLHVRCAWRDEEIWIDLDGSRAVRVSKEGWEVVVEPPILFRSFAHQKPLPEPVRGGDAWKVMEFLNLRDEDAKLLLMCYLVAGLVPDIPVPALVVHGVQGAAKTTLLKVVKGILDPSRVAVRGGVGDQGEFALAASQNRILFFDNITSVPGWLSDALCRAVTGEGWARRTLYTNEETTFFEYKIVVGLAGINLVANRPDLLDRSLILELNPVSPEERREEQSFWHDYDEAVPHILGGLFDALVKAMAVKPGLGLPKLPRMADFARWGAAAAEALGRTADEFLGAYDGNVGRQNEAAVDASPVAQAVMGFMGCGDSWKGTPSELLDELEKVAERVHVNIYARNWPKNASWLARRLREVQPNLLAMGIDVGDNRCGRRREIVLRRGSENAVTGVTGVTGGSASEGASDGNDGNDGISGGSGPEGWPEEMRKEYEERLAMMTEDGRLSEEEARKRAEEDVRKRFAERDESGIMA